MPVAFRSVAAVLIVAVAGCDAAPGLADEVRRPTLADVTLSPVSFALDTDAATAEVPLVVSGDLDSEGLVQALILVRYEETDSLVAEVAAEIPTSGRFEIPAPFAVPRGAIGDYSVRLSTQGEDGRAGDQAVTVLQFSAQNLGAPAASVAPAPPVDRPVGNARVNVPLVVTATDPDGVENLAVVFARDPESGAVIGLLADDGEDDDEEEGDGVYTEALSVTSDFEPGTYAVEVVAVDRYGAESDPAPFTFTVR